MDFSRFPRTRIVIFYEGRKPWEGMYDALTFLALERETDLTLGAEPK